MEEGRIVLEGAIDSIGKDFLSLFHLQYLRYRGRNVLSGERGRREISSTTLLTQLLLSRSRCRSGCQVE